MLKYSAELATCCTTCPKNQV